MIAAAGTTPPPASPEEVLKWGGIAVGAATLIIGVIKIWNHLNERWVSQKQYDKDIDALKKDLAAYKEQITADTERNDKLINKLETLTQAIEGCAFKKYK